METKKVLRDSEEYRAANRLEGEWLVHRVAGKWAWLIRK